uniref:Protein Nef n=1 Tax=Human immunodeficiency virus type 1 TaxID=11676 RepID=A0A142FIS8_HV1|nr:nef protein [Human immunodeficiency virus 1]
MGGKWSKSKREWPEVRERMRQTPPTSAAKEVGAVSQDLGTNTASASSASATRTWLEAQEEEEEVGFPVRPQVPLRPMTYKGAVDFSHFLKEKGGLDGLIYSQQRQEILDLWVYNTQGFFPDWQNYTPGPGTRFPLTFGWCFKLVPVDQAEAEGATEGENNSLLQHGMDDSGEVLMWKFDSRLALKHRARELHPDFYKD